MDGADLTRMSMSHPSRHRFTQLLGGDESRHQPPVTLTGHRAEPVAPEPVARKKGRMTGQAAVPDATHDWNKSEPEVLDGALTTADLAFALEHLHFTRNGLCTLRLYRDVARYLIHALRPHAARCTRPPRG